MFSVSSDVPACEAAPHRRFPGDLVGGLLPHLIGHMGVDIQGRGTGHMADDDGQGLDVHAVLQGVGGKGVAQIVKPQMLTPRPFQHRGQFFPHRRRVQGRIRFLRRGEHPVGGAAFMVTLQNIQDIIMVPCRREKLGCPYNRAGLDGI